MAFEFEWWEYFLIPWIAGAVGYVTNVVALQMTFYPTEFFGIELYRPKNSPAGFVGWQGIIPTKAEKMASLCFDLMTTKLFNIKEIFYQLDAARFSEVMEDSVLLMMDSIIDEIGSKYMPSKWESLPQYVKDDIVVTAVQECGSFLSEFMRDMQDHIDDVVDIKHMTVSACVARKHLLVNLFQECGEKEFVFIRWVCVSVKQPPWRRMSGP